MTLKNIEISKDNTIKLIFTLGYHCVLIPHGKNKTTLCISSQIGCAMDCKFCLTGKMGFIKNLTSKQILEQFEESLNYLKKEKKIENQNIYSHEIITSIVYMGMGEPFNNYNNVLESIEILNNQYSYPYKKITISTSGIIPKILSYTDLNLKTHLAVSLHSANQEKRDKIMPTLSVYKIKDLVEACNYYSKNKKDKIMIEYIMINGLTDTDEDLKQLLELNFEKMTNFNLIPLNGEMILDNKTYYPSTSKRCEYFKQVLIDNGYKCFIRFNMGEDIEAACGMLSVNSAN